MKLIGSMPAVCASLLSGAATVVAQSSTDMPPAPGVAGPGYYYVPYVVGPFFADAELGGVLMQNMRVKNNGSTLSFDPGARFDLDFGFYAAPHLSLEFETGLIWNALSRDYTQPLTAFGQDADYYQVPLLVNVVFHAWLPGGGQAYIGAGGGGVVSDLVVSYDNYQHHYYRYRDFADDSDGTLAYQAMAGVKWALGPHMEVGVGYKFMGTMSQSYFEGDATLFTRARPAYSHSILASFTYSF